MNNNQPKLRIPVGILGATGAVGQRFAELLSSHPWFEVVSLAASERSAGSRYGECRKGSLGYQISDEILSMRVCSCTPNLPCKIVFSGLDASVAGEIESEFAEAGYTVISNARNHRFDEDVPLLIPEVNSDHLCLLDRQRTSGCIVTNPNCSTVGLTMALKPLDDAFGIQRVHVVTLQAVSGAGYPGVPSIDMIDNLVPDIPGEALKIEAETRRILGSVQNGSITTHALSISAQTNRVPVVDGHIECVSVEFSSAVTREEIIHTWNTFRGLSDEYQLPSAPTQPLVYVDEQHTPQPRLCRNIGSGMTVSIGGLSACPVLGWRFTLCVHNTVRGAAGLAVLNAELLYRLNLLNINNEL